MDSQKIHVYCCGHHEIKDNVFASSYTSYSIQYQDKNGSQSSTGKFTINRRYSDFHTVRNIMVTRWPGCIIPSLPPKKLIGNTKEDFIDERQKDLQYFLQMVAKLEYLWYSQEFQIFLSFVDVQKVEQFDKVLNNLQKQSSQDLIKKYEDKFIHLSGKEINGELLNVISSFSAYIKIVKPILENFRESLVFFKQLRIKFMLEFVNHLSYLLPEYQKNLLKQYINDDADKYVLCNIKDQFILKQIALIKEIANNPLASCFQNLITIEIRQIMAVGQTLKVKNQYEQKVDQLKKKETVLNLDIQKLKIGKQGFFKSIIKNPEEEKKELEKELETNKLERQKLELIYDISIIILGYQEIQRFKQEKYRNYIDIMKDFAEIQANFSRMKIMIFEWIMQHTSSMT